VQYRDPTLVLFRGGVNSACGFASSAVGPFYCPGDQQVYLDLQFFDEMARRFSAAGDFSQAYVIAHEVGHHVQTLLGVSQQMQAAHQRGARMEVTTVCWCARNFRPTAMPASGPITPSNATTGWRKATWKKR